MNNDIILALFSALQIELILFLVFFLGYRSKFSRYWQIRITFGLFIIMIATLASAIFLAYMDIGSSVVEISTPTHTKRVVPLWLVEAIIAYIVYRHAIDGKKYLDTNVFIQTYGEKWTNPSKASKYLYCINVIPCSFLLILPVLPYIHGLQSYNKPIVILVVTVWLLSTIYRDIVFEKVK